MTAKKTARRVTIDSLEKKAVELLKENEARAGSAGSDYFVANTNFRKGVLAVTNAFGIDIPKEVYK